MNQEKLKIFVQQIVTHSKELKDKHTNEDYAPVNYAAIFCQNEIEFKDFFDAANEIGKVIKETPTGPLFQIEPLETAAGTLRLLKIRQPDVTRKERGDADFTVSDYDSFKKTYLSKPGFKLIERETMEMIELMDPAFNVRAYFSHPPLDEQLGINPETAANQ